MGTAPLRIGILGAARIAAGFCQGVAPSTAVQVTAVASRSAERAAAFAQAHAIPRVLPDYEAVLGDAQVDAVYIPLSNDQHVPWALRALAAGKHVLCEKPMALTVDDVDRLQAAAQAAGRVVLEAFPYRFQPQTLALLARVRGGRIGALRQLSGEFGFTLRNDADYRLDPALGGGALWDVGVYPLSMIRALTGRLPRTVHASAHWGPGGADHALAAVLSWDDGLMATVQCRFDALVHRHLRIVGSEGVLACGFHNHVGPGQDWIEVYRAYDGQREPVPQGNGFRLEAEALAALARGEAAHPDWPTWAETRDTTRLVQALLRSAASGARVGP